MPVSGRSSFIRCLFALALLVTAPAPAPAEEVYGPVNLLKTLATPFGAPRVDGSGEGRPGDLTILGSPIAIGGGTLATRLQRRSLGDRLAQSRLYLPGRMVLGQTAEFTVKGRPGHTVALAMADKNSGAKPIYGRQIRLGSDRKVVAVGTIPETGVATLIIDTPIQGDQIGQHWFFEAAVWSKPDFSDVEIAAPVTSEGQEGIENGVLVAGENLHKRGINFTPNAAMPLQTPESHPGSGLGTGKL